MVNKFGKDRSVYHNWLNIPEKYMSEVTGSNTMSKGKYVVTDEYLKELYDNYVLFEHNVMNTSEEDIASFDEFKKDMKQDIENGMAEGEWVPSKHDKTFCIIELHKGYAVCGWRNNSSCKMGMTFTCPIEKYNKHTCLKYKDKYYRLDRPYGWVI